MSNEIPLDIDALLKELDIECHFRQSKIRQSANMKDVMQLKAVSARGEVLKRVHEINGPKALEIAAEKRMRELLDGHLMDLRAQRDVQALDALRGQFLHREWTYLKASYPTLHREAVVVEDQITLLVICVVA